MKSILALVAVVAVSGCADQLVSNDHLRERTAFVLNVPPPTVAISDRRYDGMMTTYYNASTPAGSFQCMISGGSINLLGLTDPPLCSRVAEPEPAPVRRHRGRRAASR